MGLPSPSPDNSGSAPDGDGSIGVPAPSVPVPTEPPQRTCARCPAGLSKRGSTRAIVGLSWAFYATASERPVLGGQAARTEGPRMLRASSRRPALDRSYV